MIRSCASESEEEAAGAAAAAAAAARGSWGLAMVELWVLNVLCALCWGQMGGSVYAAVEKGSKNALAKADRFQIGRGLQVRVML
jgi:hypothetical protein